MNQLTELADSVEADVAKDDLKELVAEEMIKVVESSLGNVPGLSILSKLGKTYQSVRDYFLMEKVIAFLTDLSSLKVGERKKLIDKINSDPIYGQKFGKFVILAIDRLEYADKAVYLARACKFYEQEQISKPLFIRLKGIIEKVELSDLQTLGYAREKGYYGYPRNFGSERLFLFQSLDLIIFKHTIHDFEKYKELDIKRETQGLTKPGNPKLSDLGRILIHIINDIPFERHLSYAAKSYKR